MKINNVTKEIIAHRARIGNRKSHLAGLSYRQCTNLSRPCLLAQVPPQIKKHEKTTVLGGPSFLEK